MRYRLVQCRAWVRTGTHTVVPERDPDFARLEAGPTGTVVRLLRVWCEPNDASSQTWYLGACLCTPGRFRSDLRRLLRRAGTVATAAGEPRRPLRTQLTRTLRRAAA